jgi:hypothetical protein
LRSSIESGRDERAPRRQEYATGWHTSGVIESNEEAVVLVAVVEMAPGHTEAGRRYEDEVLALLGRHGGSLETRLHSTDSAAEVHVIRFRSRAGYESFLIDPERLALREALGAAVPTTRVIEVHDGSSPERGRPRDATHSVP